jgi:tryptophan halogenase
VKNVCAIGNAHGFVEPLEATAIAAICEAAVSLTYALATNGRIITKTIRDGYNNHANRYWDAIRRFLSVHYKYNKRLDTEFWRAAREKTDLAGAEQVCEFYEENGPSAVWTNTLIDTIDQFGMEGYLTMFVGQRVPYANKYTPPPRDAEQVNRMREQFRQQAMVGYSVEQALALVRHPGWSWTPGFFRD